MGWDDDYPYMTDECFAIKWGVMKFLVEKYCRRPIRVLDIACGKVNLSDFMSIDTWVGIDSSKEVVSFHARAGRSCFWKTLQDGFVVSERLFNCLIWAGIEPSPKECPEILRKWLANVAPGGIVILDYMNLKKEDPSDRVEKLPLKHLTGCSLSLPYIHGEKIGRWPKIGERTIEVYRVEKN